MIKNYDNNNIDMPPSNLQGEALAQWWRDHGAGSNNIETESDYERKCPRCFDYNPCTGNSTCISCGESLAGARKVSSRESSRHSRPGE